MITVMADSTASVAQDPSAPASERYDAQVELTKSSLQDQLFGKPEVREAISQIQEMLSERDERLSKAGSNLIVGPWSGGQKNKIKGRGPESIFLDDFQLIVQGGGYWERPGALSFTAMRAMVEQTPILNGIVLTRQRQVMRFCRPRMGDSGPGFAIKHVDPNRELEERDLEAIQLLQKFILNCGWEFDPRRRKALKRDNFGQFMAKHIRDSLIMDAAPIETEWKRDKGLGIDGFYAVDGATIRLCTELGYEGDDSIFALQVIEGNIRTAYSYEDLIYEVRNPRTDVIASGYGYSETEMLIRVVTYLLNTMTYNAGFFDKNSIPRGILNLYGNYTPEDIAAFKRQWQAMLRGAANSHNLPVMVSKDQESKADYVEVGGQMTEMAFSSWLTFLTSIACAVYGTAPEEVNMASFAENRSALSGSDTEEKLVSSNDKGLRPLLSHVENTFSDFVIQPFSEDLMFRFEGLDDTDQAQAFELRKLASTWNETRKETGLEPIDGPMGDCPMNPSLIPMWQQESGVGQPEEDFGDPDAQGGGFGDDQNAGEADEGAEGGQDMADQGADDMAAGESAEVDGYGRPLDQLSKALATDYGLPPVIYRLGDG